MELFTAVLLAPLTMASLAVSIDFVWQHKARFALLYGGLFFVGIFISLQLLQFKGLAEYAATQPNGPDGTFDYYYEPISPYANLGDAVYAAPGVLALACLLAAAFGPMIKSKYDDEVKFRGMTATASSGISKARPATGSSGGIYREAAVDQGSYGPPSDSETGSQQR
jgi:hypothetical protein